MKSTYPLSRYVVFATTCCIFALVSGASADSAGLSDKKVHGCWETSRRMHRARATGAILLS
jgi:hypothetical protein